MSARTSGLRFGATAALLVFLAGCSKSELPSEYGRTSGPVAGNSVNGTAVLAGMIEARGHRVGTARNLTPKLFSRADVLIWFMPYRGTPSREVRTWLEEWLQVEPNRVLVVVGRDYDAAPEYWRRMAAKAPPDLAAEYKRREALAQQEMLTPTPWTMPPPAASNDAGSWFTLDHRLPPRRVQTLSGAPEWITQIDPLRTDVELDARMIPARGCERWLESDGELIVGRKPIGSSEVVLIVNGSFLLNLPLVNHEHRKLAGRLIDAMERGGTPRRVVFIEPWIGDPGVFDKEPQATMPGAFTLLSGWPLAGIVVHLAVAGLLLCFWRWPIFGPVAATPSAGAGDFGGHVLALGDMLRRTRDAEFAAARLKAYEQLAHAEKQRRGERGQVRQRRV
ncbi:MAG: hypothetical protein K1X74_03675 [Pirellulales bacterium]|nr:hypothetical protein [Pirellulales bacterium]